eukprot:4315849-Pleurochrysis_carterae.AAC.1
MQVLSIHACESDGGGVRLLLCLHEWPNPSRFDAFFESSELERFSCSDRASIAFTPQQVLDEEAAT